MTVKVKKYNGMRASGHSIDIRDESPRKYKLSLPKVEQTASRILQALGWKKAAVSLWLVSDRKIRALNKRFMKHDWATDVISFSQWEGRKLKVQGLSAKQSTVPLGDLIISLDTTARQAKEYGNSFFYEFSFYLCHGILHLMGYDDKTPREAKTMEKKQAAILRKIGISSERKKEKGERQKG